MMISRNIRALLVVLFVVMLPALWLFRPVDPLPARFAADDCLRVDLIDSASGAPVGHVGDMALLSDGDTVILAAANPGAPDGQAAEPGIQSGAGWGAGAGAGTGGGIGGGLYRVSLTALAGGAWTATSITTHPTPAGGLVPLSLAVSADDSQLAFINRNRDGTVSVIGGVYRNEVFSPRYVRSEPEFCRARDLDISGEGEMGVRVTLDRAECGFSAADLAPSARNGRVIGMDLADIEAPVTLQSGLAEPVGIDGLYLGESRLERLADALGEPVALPGRPDRLTRDASGALLVALHPSLPKDLAYRYGFAGSAPSRILRLDIDGRAEALFDDAEGDLFSAASAAVLADGVLLAGSESESSVLVCNRR